jgi:hypothetical protein
MIVVVGLPRLKLSIEITDILDDNTFLSLAKDAPEPRGGTISGEGRGAANG